eukprot:3812787-Rhodomonas_salina.1
MACHAFRGVPCVYLRLGVAASFPIEAFVLLQVEVPVERIVEVVSGASATFSTLSCRVSLLPLTSC